MLGFPQTTEFNKRIPKQKFYENLDVPPALKRVFAEQIKLIHWRNKLADTTLNIAQGQKVTEIEVIEIKLAQPQLAEAVLKQIDQQIHYHILFVLSWEEKVQAWIGHKEAAEAGNKTFKVNKYFHTDWMPPEELTFEIQGLNLDAVWENLVRRVEGGAWSEELSFEEDIARKQQLDTLAKKIEKLEKQARNENQPNKKFQLAQQARALKQQLAEINQPSALNVK